MATKQGSEGGIDVEDTDIPKLETIANIIPINSNLTTKNKARIRSILGNGSDLELGLDFTRQPDMNIIKEIGAKEMPSLGGLAAQQSDGRGRRSRWVHIHINRWGRREMSRSLRLSLSRCAKKGHQKVVSGSRSGRW